MLWTVIIHVILAWNEIGRAAIFYREIGVPDREVFLRRTKFSFSGKNCLNEIFVKKATAFSNS